MGQQRTPSATVTAEVESAVLVAILGAVAQKVGDSKRRHDVDRLRYLESVDERD